MSADLDLRADCAADEAHRQSEAAQVLASRRTEVLTWKHTRHELPDDDMTCLVSIDDDECSTWLGFRDGDVWRDAATGAEIVRPVIAWCDMPDGWQP